MPARCLTEPIERTMLRGGGELVLAKSEKKTPVFASERELREIRILAGGTAKAEQIVQPQPGAIVPMVAEKTKALRLGHPDDGDVQIGANVAATVSGFARSRRFFFR